LIPLVSKKRRGNFFVFLVIVGVLCFTAISVLAESLGPVNASNSAYSFKVSKGENVNTIAHRLEKEGRIKSEKAFILLSLIMSNAHRFQPGIFPLDLSMSTPEIIMRLTSQNYNSVKVTIIEGMTLKDIDALLTKEGIGGENETFLSVSLDGLSVEFPFLKNISSLEGFLFPDTYYFPSDADRSAIARIFLQNFNKKALSQFENEKSIYKTISVASILEREVPNHEDQRLVAGIIEKRLKAGMPLQVDASVIYGKCNGFISGCESPVMYRSDTALHSPYNTYKYTGLPPTPISNAGLGSIKAALNPKASGYWYYLSDPKTSKTIFSTTLDEHNFKRSIYLGRNSVPHSGG